MRPEERSSEYRRLQKITHRNLLHLIDSELNLALTMTELAETEADLGDGVHGRLLLEKVEQAMDSVRHHVNDHRLFGGEKQEIADRMK